MVDLVIKLSPGDGRPAVIMFEERFYTQVVTAGLAGLEEKPETIFYDRATVAVMTGLFLNDNFIYF